MRAQGVERTTAGDAQQVCQGGSDLIQAGRGRGGALAAGQMIVEEGVDRRPGHVLEGDVLGGEPDAEVLDGLDVLLDGARGWPRASNTSASFGLGSPCAR